jgi:four helix bundle protein
MRWKTSLKERAFAFAVKAFQIQQCVAKLGTAHAHMGSQLFRASSAVGAMLEEGDVAASRRDMGAKHAIALREAKESRYWVRLLLATGLPEDEQLSSVLREAGELVAMLTTSVRKLRGTNVDHARSRKPPMQFIAPSD